MILSGRRLRYAIVIGLLVFIAGTTGWSFAAQNVIQPSTISYASVPITANQLKPPQCAMLDLTNYIVIVGNGAIHGTNGNDLILGSSGKDNIHGNGGDDCIVGGGGGDQIFGDVGNDVCIGGGDNKDKFHDCETVVP